uniref:Uncharacterized protein n=1 Tax=Brassica oleracea TaxID=3712 RepID=A0A3P6FXU8_BRAOL|nr:unnamed protein product [Brassica oleracea]
MIGNGYEEMKRHLNKKNVNGYRRNVMNKRTISSS